MFLILSARSVGEDIALQYGRLAPSFLPLGNRRLYTEQATLAEGGMCAMTVSDDLIIQSTDMRSLEASGIRLIPQPSDLSLTAAIRHALLELDTEEPIQILYGDTLVYLRPEDRQLTDIVAVHETTANYQWAYVLPDADFEFRFSGEAPCRLDTRRVVCGYYVFADPGLLARACELADIVDALNYYHSKRGLRLVGAERWYDFGHLPLYFRSRKDALVKRAFNEIEHEDQYLVKKSDDTGKMRAEANWYECLPANLRLHIPRFGGRVERGYQAGYAIEYLHHPLLSDLAAFGELPLPSWLEILAAIFDFMKRCHEIRPAAGAPERSPRFATEFFNNVVVTKTLRRLAQFSDESHGLVQQPITINGINYPPMIVAAESLLRMVPPSTSDHIRFWHGDLFFGNMFYDFTAQRIMAIDPRGRLDSGELCLYGDLRYDLAKLAHSVVGQYDKLILGRSFLEERSSRDWYFFVESQENQRELEEIFFAWIAETYNINRGELLALTALLFFSMLPLHSERPDLQKQFIATGLKLSSKAQGIEE